MPRLQPVRLLLAALLVLFSAPVVGFADAVVFHGGEARAASPAVGAPDISWGHGDSCQLASHQGHATPEAALRADTVGACEGDRPFQLPASVPATNRTTLPPARAPPA